MNIAIIDCGTNTFNLLVANAHKGGWEVIFENKLAVKLGAGGFATKEILPSRFIRGIDALAIHAQNTRNFGCDRVFAFATSAVREADNGAEFIKVVKAKTGIELQLIDGDREAELIYEGVRQTMDLGDDPVLIMDIGGGSTEFIIANSNEILWKKSFLLGVSRLFDLVKPGDKMKQEEVNALKHVLHTELVPLREALKQWPCVHLIGSSGSFDTLLSLYKYNMKEEAVKPGLANDIPVQAFPSIHRYLMGSTYQERLNHKAIPTIRAEYMPLASYLVKTILEMGNFVKMTHSAYALKEGAIMSLISTITWPETTGENEQPEDYLEE